MTEVLRRTWATIDMDALRHNLSVVQEALSPAARCMAVVKSDAYGHGAVPIARELEAAGADWFGVATLEEAVQLRQGGITAPILILSYTPTAAVAKLADYDLAQTVLDADYAARLEQAAAAKGIAVRVHIKVDTGMSRIGFHGDNTVLDIVTVCSYPHLNAEGIFTHFPAADTCACDEQTRSAFVRFTDVLAQLEAAGITFSYRHCCNSAATFRFPEMQLDMVRAGIVLYGASPSQEMQGALPLKPVMTLNTVVSQCKTVPADTPVGYGSTYRTTDTATLATLPIGYGDGLLRIGAASLSVTINGQPAKLVGRVCMDQCVADITAIPNVAVGHSAVVFGNGGQTADAYAAACQTIPYETLCLVGKRVPRVYYRDGQPFAAHTLLQP